MAPGQLDDDNEALGEGDAIISSGSRLISTDSAATKGAAATSTGLATYTSKVLEYHRRCRDVDGHVNQQACIPRHTSPAYRAANHIIRVAARRRWRFRRRFRSRRFVATDAVGAAGKSHGEKYSAHDFCLCNMRLVFASSRGDSPASRSATSHPSSRVGGVIWGGPVVRPAARDGRRGELSRGSMEPQVLFLSPRRR